MKKAHKYMSSYLNTSPCKQAHSFEKSARFIQQKSYSPNKFYNLPELATQRSTTIGRAKKSTQIDGIEIGPGEYQTIDNYSKKQKKGFCFGIGRQEYYKYAINKKKMIPSPGIYNLREQKTGYKYHIGKKPKQRKSQQIPGPNQYSIPPELLDRLSSHKRQINTKIKTDINQKGLFYYYDNKTPGVGQYMTDIKSIQASLKLNNSKGPKFGRQSKNKHQRSVTEVGPGSYNTFSAFGDN